jgi:hypothetical protein
METSFDPVNQLTTLLGPKPNHPWSALIPQVLLWSFRRFCIMKLIASDDIPITEQLWDDHFEMIHLYAPKGLENASSSWLSPENIDHLHAPLEEYNRFFFDFLLAIEESYRDNDLEDKIAVFLDDTIKYIIRDWLGEKYAQFLIFPMRDEDEEEFTDKQFDALLESLITFSPETTPAEPVVEPAIEPPVEPPVEPAIEPPVEPPVEPAIEPPVEPPVEPVPIVEPAQITVRAALKRHRTFRAGMLRLTRGKTRKLIPPHKQRDD